MRTTPEDLTGSPIQKQNQPLNDLPRNVADRFRGARIAKNLSQVDLAKAIFEHTEQWACRTVENMIGKLERGESPAGVTVLVMIAAELLDVMPDWLLGRTDDPIPHTPLPETCQITIDEAAEMKAQLSIALDDLQGLQSLMGEQITLVQALQARLGKATAPLVLIEAEPLLMAAQ